MPYAPQTWTDDATLVDKLHMDHIEAGIVTADANATTALAQSLPQPVVNGQWIKGAGGVPVWSAIAQSDVTGLTTALAGKASLDANGHVPDSQRMVVGSTPPGSPLDGDQWLCNASGVGAWLFRYNAGGGTYKWEFIGGAPTQQAVDVAQATTSTGLVDLGTVGPQLTVPRAGDYLCQVSLTAIQSAATGTFSAGTTVTPATWGNVTAQGMLTGAGAGWLIQLSGFGFLSAVPGGTVLKMQYQTASGQSVSFQYRRMMIIPVHVS